MTTLSPSSRGLLPGLFLALAAAFAVLALNSTWLLPAVDDDGYAYLLMAPQLAAGAAAEVPAARWDDPNATAGLEGRGSLMPAAMATVVRAGRRPHVAALWILALSAGLVALTAAWVGGGAGGMWGGVAAALGALLSPLLTTAATAIRPELLVTGLVGLQLGLMVYRPGWSWAHGIAGAAAWLAHPVGVGAVAAAVVWPLRERRSPSGVVGAGVAALPALALYVAGHATTETLLPPSVGRPSLHGLGTTLEGVLSWASGGWGGLGGAALGAAVCCGAALLVAADARGTPPAPRETHWSQPAAADVLQEILRPAAALLALSLLIASAVAGGDGAALARPWTPVVLPLAVLWAASAVRRGQGRSGAASRLPAIALCVWLAVGGVNATRTYLDVREVGRGHTAAHWVASDLIRWVDNRSAPYAVLYASDPGLVLLQSGRRARTLPTDEGEHTAFLAAFHREPGALLLFGEAAERLGGLAEELALVEVVRTEHGRILVPSGPPPP